MTRQSAKSLVAWTTAVVAGILALGAPVGAQGVPVDDTAQRLAETYAPIIKTVAQEAPCDEDGEPYAPMNVDALLANPEIVLRQVGTGDPVVAVGPEAAHLFELGEGFYLDFPGIALEPECIYERDGRRYVREFGPTVYAHIVVQEDQPDQLALQYWFFWYYNDWNNKHEGDWEGIQLLFDTGSVDEALERGPVAVGYAQHEGGESADWDSDKLEREGTRPVVYPSAGSHASYFGSELHLGRSASEGFGCDTTVGPSTRIDPAIVVLPDAVDDPDDPLAWLAYDGRWGERQGGPFNGPTGPTAKERWTHPVDWHDELRSSSVVIPGGESSLSVVMTAFCDVVEWGAERYITLTLSPVRLVVTAAILGWIFLRLIRRTDWAVVEPLPLERRRRGGQILRASFRLLSRSSTIALIGVAFMPITFVAGLIARVVASLPFVHQFLELAGTGGIAGLIVAGTLAASAGLVAFVGVNAAIVAHLGDADDIGDRLGLGDSLRAVRARAGTLFTSFARAYLIVVVLAFTVVGLPFAVYVLVRAQFAPHVVMRTDCTGREALRRSAQLVHGRWWHTALMVLLINAAIAAVSLVIGVLMLVVFAALPLWLFSGVLTLTTAMVSPVAAVALTLLYGDAVAETDGLGPAARPARSSEGAVEPDTVPASTS